MQLEKKCRFSLRVINDRISRTKYFLLCKTDCSVTLVVHYLCCWTTNELSVALKLYILKLYYFFILSYYQLHILFKSDGIFLFHSPKPRHLFYLLTLHIYFAIYIHLFSLHLSLVPHFQLLLLDKQKN